MEPRSFRPYVAETFPQFAPDVDVTIPTVSPARTFWEKAALVHEQLSRPGDRPLPAFQARHLYDLHRLWQRTEVTQAPGLAALFESVKQHRATFFGYNWMDYARLNPSNLKLVPDNEKAAAWRDDYARMRPMFFTTPPAFDDLLIHLREIEKSLTIFD